MYYYITHPCEGIRPTWNKVVAGPFTSKDELQTSVLSHIASCDDECELTGILDFSYATASEKRVGNGKSLRNDWICFANKLSESKNESIQIAIQEKRKEFPSRTKDYGEDLLESMTEEEIKQLLESC
jgi:hypothetical protein